MRESLLEEAALEIYSAASFIKVGRVARVRASTLRQAKPNSSLSRAPGEAALFETTGCKSKKQLCISSDLRAVYQVIDNHCVHEYCSMHNFKGFLPVF